MHHKLKTWPAYFHAVAVGVKQFEIRDNSDRGFQKGDTVTLEEFDPKDCHYSGQKLEKRITYVTGFKQAPGFVVFGIEDV